MIKIILIVFVSLYLFVMVGFYFFQDKLIFYPQKFPDGSNRIIKYKNLEVIIDVDGVTLHGWLINRGKEKLILYYGGNAEEVSCNIDDFSYLENYSFLLMNYRGYGKSDGTPSEKHLFSDAVKIFDHITDTLRIQPENRVLFGRSLGTGVALYVASKRDVSSIILVTPFDSIRNIVKDRMPIFPVNRILKHPFNSIAYAKDVSCPSLVLMAKNDSVINNKYSMNLVKNMRGDCRYYVIEDAGHNNIHTFPEYWSLIMDYLNP